MAQVLERATACCDWARGSSLAMDIEVVEASRDLADVVDLAQRMDIGMNSHTSVDADTRTAKHEDKVGIS